MRKPEIIVALDVARAEDIPAILDRLPAELEWFKVGLELFVAAGPAALMELKHRRKKIFLDLKLHDIPQTVSKAVQSALPHGVQMLTLHAAGGRAMLKAAAEAAAGAGDQKPILLAVTTLTSLDQNDLRDVGIQRSTSEQAVALAELALGAGVDGVVTSVHEAGALRARLGNAPVLVTPGIRMPEDAVGDQKRIATPRTAMLAGSNYLVMGRPILQAADPRDAVRRILADLNE